MGSFYKKEIFNDHVQQGVLGWAQKVKMRKGLKEGSAGGGDTAGPSVKIEMMRRAAREGNDEAGVSIE
jgi:mlo protein